VDIFKEWKREDRALDVTLKPGKHDYRECGANRTPCRLPRAWENAFNA